MSAASWSGVFRRGTTADDDREDDRKDDDDGLQEPEVGDPSRVVLAPAPDRERGVASRLEPDRPLPERAHRVPERRLEQEDRERERRSRPRRPLRSARSGAASATGYVAQSGATSSAPNFVQPASATDAPRAQSEVTSRNPSRRSAGMIASFVFAFSVYAVNGYAAQPNASSDREPPASEPQADEDEREHGEQVERDRGRVRGRQRVPLPAPREDGDGRDVREVGHWAVRIAALDRGLAAAVRLDALADLPLGVLRPARLEVAALRHVPVRRLAVEDPARADDAREPDVDHASRRLQVQPDPESEQEHRSGGERPGRPDAARAPDRGGRARPTARVRAGRRAPGRRAGRS